MSKRLATGLVAVVNIATSWQPVWRCATTRLRVSNMLAQTHRVDTRHGPISFLSSHPHPLRYPRLFFSREPETLAWIDGFETPSVFWDIGANVGAYSLYAGRRGIEVLAFEPAASSYAALCENIRLNRLDGHVHGYCLALSDQTKLATLNMEETHPASVFHAFDDNKDCFGEPLEVRFRQGMIGYSIDDLCATFDLAIPNYLKIDVDSIEERILLGAHETLRNAALRSVLIELEEEDGPRNRSICQSLNDAGFHAVSTGAAGGTGSRNAIFARKSRASGL